MRSGTIVVLYKKGDPREIRNYRPITLLNVDYKIYAKLLVERMKFALEYVVSPEQLGFVPGRVIGEASHLVKLIQAYLDESDCDGLFVAIDWEKAYDRASWDYKAEAYKALGFGEKYCEMVALISNEEQPPCRTVRTNGATSAQFTLHSGVPQGCPFSPLDFLILLEALSRAIKSNKDIHGIVVDTVEHILSQFADDTLAMLRGYESLRDFWREIFAFEKASGMKVNMPKTNAFRGGSLRKVEPPTDPELHTDLIQWVKGRKYVKILGIPFWEGEGNDEFWEELYLKIKTIVSGWRRATFLSPLGRVMLANFMIYSRVRYVEQVLTPPKWFDMCIEEDVQALIWGKDFRPSATEWGTQTEFTRWIREDAQTNKTKQGLGLGLVPWADHQKGLRARWLMRYLDATQSPWKQVADQWFTRHVLGRGAILSTYPIADLTCSLTYRAPKLPKFWHKGISELRSLKLTQIPGTLTRDGARNIPVWYSPSFPPPGGKLKDFWISLKLISIRDTVKPDGTDYTKEDILKYAREGRRENEDGHLKVAKDVWAHPDYIWEDWMRILDKIPKFVREAARAASPYNIDYGPAVRMMTAMAPNWSIGKGLGRAEQGRIHPVTAPTGTQPRGPSLNCKNRSKKSRTSEALAKHVCYIENKTFKYAAPSEALSDDIAEAGFLIPVDTSVRGRPIRREGRDTRKYDPDELLAPAIWGDGLNGVAEANFPAPREWSFFGCQRPVDETSVKVLTALFARQHIIEPTCVKRWEEINVGPLKWAQVKSRYSEAFLTRKDFWLHFKHILHRKFYTRVAQRLQDNSCRCCGKARENIEHFGSCSALEPLRIWLADLTGEYMWTNPITFLVGCHPLTESPPGAASLWLLLWGSIIRNLVRMSTEGDPLDVDKIKTNTLRTFLSRASALEYQALLIRSSKLSRGGDPPTIYPKLSRLITPMGEISKSTYIVWSPEFLKALERANLSELVKEQAEGEVTINSPPSQPDRNLIRFVRPEAPRAERG